MDMTKTETDISVVTMKASANNVHANDAVLGSGVSYVAFADPATDPIELSLTINSAVRPSINSVTFTVTGASEVNYVFSDNGVNFGNPTVKEISSPTSATQVSDKLSTPVDAYTVTLLLIAANPALPVEVSGFVVSACYKPGNCTFFWHQTIKMTGIIMS